MRRAALVLLATCARAAAQEPFPCPPPDEARAEVLALHRYRASGGLLAAPRGPADTADGEVAVLHDRGDLVAARNAFDLDQSALRFVPRGDGYALARMAAAVPSPGPPLALGSGAAVEVALPFAFPFYGRAYRSVFVHAGGFLTFDRADAAGGAPGLRRLLDGPPRVAAFFAELDPSRGGSVSARVGADAAAFVWSALPGGGQINRNTFAATLLPDGQVELAWGEVQTRETIVGLAPGGGGDPV